MTEMLRPGRRRVRQTFRNAPQRLGNRCALRRRALAASTSRYLGGALVSKEWRSLLEIAAIPSTAAAKAASFALEGLLNPLTFLTNCSEAARISSSVTGGAKLKRVLMLRHISDSSMYRDVRVERPVRRHVASANGNAHPAMCRCRSAHPQRACRGRATSLRVKSLRRSPATGERCHPACPKRADCFRCTRGEHLRFDSPAHFQRRVVSCCLTSQGNRPRDATRGPLVATN